MWYKRHIIHSDFHAPVEKRQDASHLGLRWWAGPSISSAQRQSSWRQLSPRPDSLFTTRNAGRGTRAPPLCGSRRMKLTQTQSVPPEMEWVLYFSCHWGRRRAEVHSLRQFRRTWFSHGGVTDLLQVPRRELALITFAAVPPLSHRQFPEPGHRVCLRTPSMCLEHGLTRNST